MDCLQHQYAPSTNLADRSHMKKWNAHCADLGTPPLRSDIAANIGVDLAGHKREVFLMCTGVMKFHRTMSPRCKGDVAALPQSALNVVLGAHREMRRCGITPPSTKMLQATLKSLLRQFIQVHGQRRLMPQRAAPMLRSTALKVLHDTSAAPSSLRHMSWRAAQGLLSGSGMRGDELVLRGAKGLSCAHVAFKAKGVAFSILCATADDTRRLLETLATLTTGDYLVVTPPPSKSDQFGLIWGVSSDLRPLRQHGSPERCDADPRPSPGIPTGVWAGTGHPTLSV